MTTTAMHPSQTAENPVALRFSVRGAIAQLRFVWPGVVRRHQDTLEVALGQVDEDFVARFQDEHPRGDACAIARCGPHEVILRGLSRNEPVAYWVEGRLLGSYRAFGVLAEEIEAERAAHPRRRRGRCAA